MSAKAALREGMERGRYKGTTIIEIQFKRLIGNSTGVL